MGSRKTDKTDGADTIQDLMDQIWKARPVYEYQLQLQRFGDEVWEVKLVQWNDSETGYDSKMSISGPTAVGVLDRLLQIIDNDGKDAER